MPEQKVTLEQANAALEEIVKKASPDDEEEAPVEEPTKEEEPSPEPEQAAQAEPSPEEAAVPQAAQEDDLDSLRKRLEERETQQAEREKAHEARVQALQKRQAENERIMRERYLRKSTTVDKALRILKGTRTEQGVSETEVDAMIREIESGMNPASPSYVPATSGTATDGMEEQAIILNRFLNEMGMDDAAAQKFGDWMRTEAPNVLKPGEQAVANESLQGFLRIAHGRWQEGVAEKEREKQRATTVEAVKSVQRTQKEAARAASASPNAPKKQPAGAKTEIDTKKLSKNDVAKLLQMSVTQYQ